MQQNGLIGILRSLKEPGFHNWQLFWRHQFVNVRVLPGGTRYKGGHSTLWVNMLPLSFWTESCLASHFPRIHVCRCRSRSILTRPNDPTTRLLGQKSGRKRQPCHRIQTILGMAIASQKSMRGASCQQWTRKSYSRHSSWKEGICCRLD